MFRSVHPVCPVTDLSRSLSFWRKLGFELAFIDSSAPEDANYVGVRRDELLLHLQVFTNEQILTTQTMAIRIEMDDLESLEALYIEWKPLKIITADIGDRPWGNREFGFYDPDGTPFFFCVGASG